MVTYRRASAQAVFHAIAEPTRRRLLDELSTGPRAAGALASRFLSSRPAIAKHLRILRQAGLVRVRRTGRHRIYSLRPAPLAAAGHWIERYEAFWNARLDELTSYVEARREKRRGHGH